MAKTLEKVCRIRESELENAFLSSAEFVLAKETTISSEERYLELIRKRALIALFQSLALQMAERYQLEIRQDNSCDFIADHHLVPTEITDLGDYYQALVSCKLAFAGDKLRVIRQSRIQKRAGCYYTSHKLVDKIVQATLGERLTTIPSILDPSAGTGNFLLGCAQHLDKLGFDRVDIIKSLHGCDTDPVATKIAQLSLWLWCGKRSLMSDDIKNIRCADSLAANAYSTKHAYEVVIGNPPWVSFFGRQAEAIDENMRRDYCQRFPGFKGWLSTHGLFLELATQVSETNGRISLLLPLQISDLAGYAALRKVVTAHASLEVIENIGEFEFCGVTQPAGTYYFRKRNASVTGSSDPWKYGSIDQLRSCSDTSILAKMLQHAPLPSETFRDSGVHTGNSQAIILTDDLSARNSEPIREGRQIMRYTLSPARKRLLHRQDLPPGSYFRIGRRESYHNATILIRQTASRPIAALHTEPAYFRNSILGCYPAEGYDPYALLALLNSRLIAYFHYKMYRDSHHQTFPQVKISHLRSIPIPANDMSELANLARNRIEQGSQNPDRCSRIEQAIDQLVYCIYDLSREEVEKVENEPIKLI